MQHLPIILFWLLGIIGGSNFIFMKLATELITPIQVVVLRVLFGLFPIAIYAWSQSAFKISHAKHIGHFFVMATVGTVAYYYGFVKGASLLPSGITGALSGLTPIFSYLLAVMMIAQERFVAHRLLGIIIGFIGILFIARPFTDGLSQAGTMGVLYTMIGAFGIGGSIVYVKKYLIPLNIPPSALVTYQLGLASIILLFLIDMDNIGHIFNDTQIAAGLILGLGILGTGFAFIIYYYIIEKLGPVKTASVAYIPPIVALIIGFFAGEEIGIQDYLGVALILLGVVLTTREKL